MNDWKVIEKIANTSETTVGYLTAVQYEAVAWRYSAKEMFLKILQNSQENTCVGVSFLNKVAGLRSDTASDTVVFLWILQNF